MTAALKHLDDVIGDAFSHAAVERASHRRLCRKARFTPDNMLNTNKVKQGKAGIWSDVDEDIDVTIGVRIVARPRAEDGEADHTLGA